MRKDKNLLKTYVLISAFENNHGIVPVKLLVKEFRDGRNNSLHVSITLPTINKAGIADAKGELNPASTPHPAYTVNLS